MPPRLTFSASTGTRLSAEAYVCPSCLLRVKACYSRQPDRVNDTTRRAFAAPARNVEPRAHFFQKNKTIRAQIVGRELYARSASNDSLASSTAVNAIPTVPPPLRELHQKLSALQYEAGGYVDLSRLQLATRSLESENPVVRIALHGLGESGTDSARKLARVLIADPLSEQEAWESKLVESSTDGRSLLLKYGDAGEPMQSSPLVQTMHIPARFLRRNNLELLVTTFVPNMNSSSAADVSALEEALLVPSITTPSAAHGRVGFVRYPVHKAVVVAEGVMGAVEFGGLPRTLTDSGLLSAALNTSIRNPSVSNSGRQSKAGFAVDVDLAMHSIDLFRASKAKGAQFNEEWQASRVPFLTEWIAGTKESSTEMTNQAAIRNSIGALLSEAATSISVAEDAENALVTANTVPESKRTLIRTAIASWYAESHRDLQSNLDTAFSSSKTWRRTAWWRLIWRIDDVALCAADVLRQSWLDEAERRLAFVSGRVLEAGLADEEQLRSSAPRLLPKIIEADMEQYEIKKGKEETAAELLQVPSMLARMRQQSGINALFTPPWPQTINLSRQYMIQSRVPAFHSKAQALLFTALSTVGGAAALSVWLFIATSGIALYECGAIFSLGLVVGLRRLQKKWSEERTLFATTVREDARSVLAEVETQLRSIVNEGGRASVQPEDAKSREDAARAVRACRQALDEVIAKSVR